jgi:glycosyltransferase involved in cell wall biosynthesis
MKILILSSPDPTKTAGVVARDIYDGLARIKGNKVKMLVKSWNKYDDENIITCESRLTAFNKNIYSRLKNKLLKYKIIKKVETNPDYHVQDYDQTKTYYSSKKMIAKVGFTPDVILVLFMQNFISYKNLYQFQEITHAKTFLMLMDMAPYTGICHYAWDCLGYTKQCGQCPALYSDNPNDQSYVNWKFKKESIQKLNLAVINSTEWQLKQTQQSTLYANKPLHKILLSIKPEIFKPVQKEQLRLEMGLPAEKKIIFFGCTELQHTRKGMRYLLDSLDLLYEKVKSTHLENNIMLLIAGKGIESIHHLLKFEYKYIGMLHNSYSLAKAYQVADIFICPSIEDSGPTMINQSIMCGTPVVAFKMGVALDLVITNETGYLAKLKDVEDLCTGVAHILNLNKLQYNTIANNCRNLGLTQYTPEVQISQLIKLFD